MAEFVENLAEDGELVRVETGVDPRLEISAIAMREASRTRRAVLFERVQGHEYGLITGLLGSRRRVVRALGVDCWEELVNRISGPSQTGRWWAGTSAEDRRFRPKRTQVAPCQQVVRLGEDVDLGALPVLQAWPDQDVRVINPGLEVHPPTPVGERCVRQMAFPILDRNVLLLAEIPHPDPVPRAAPAGGSAVRVPIAVVLGGDPLTMVLAGLPIDASPDLFAWAGQVKQRSVELVGSRTHDDLEVPAEADFVIEGYVDRSQALVEAPYCPGPRGRYYHPSPGRRLHVTALTHRSNPILPTAVTGDFPGEDNIMGQLALDLLRPRIQDWLPEVVEIVQPEFGASGDFLFVSIRKSHAGQAGKIAGGLWSLTPLINTKFIVVVDESVDTHDTERVLYCVGTQVDPRRDVFFQDGPPRQFDHSADDSTRFRRMGIDATTKLPAERTRPWTKRMVMPKEIVEAVERKWEEYGLA